MEEYYICVSPLPIVWPPALGERFIYFAILSRFI
jgi:hypothetical protein